MHFWQTCHVSDASSSAHDPCMLMRLITGYANLAPLVKVGSTLKFCAQIAVFFTPFITVKYLGGDLLRQFKSSVSPQTFTY